MSAVAPQRRDRLVGDHAVHHPVPADVGEESALGKLLREGGLVLRSGRRGHEPVEAPLVARLVVADLAQGDIRARWRLYEQMAAMHYGNNDGIE